MEELEEEKKRRERKVLRRKGLGTFSNVNSLNRTICLLVVCMYVYFVMILINQ